MDVSSNANKNGTDAIQRFKESKFYQKFLQGENLCDSSVNMTSVFSLSHRNSVREFSESRQYSNAGYQESGIENQLLRGQIAEGNARLMQEQ